MGTRNLAEERALAVCERVTRELAALINKHPEHRATIAYVMLGNAVAICDTFGLDVEGWLAELRRREPRPAVLVPPQRRSS